MTLKECYQILNVDQSATLEEVKRAYRRRAFELHPDLNPNVSDANRQFQRLNEAYVILNRLVAAREAAGKDSTAKGPTGQEPPRPGARWYDWGFSFGGKKEEAQKDDAQGAAPTNEERQAQREERRAQREEAYREEIRREESRQRERKREEERRQEERRKVLERERAERAEKRERERQQAEQSSSAKPDTATSAASSATSSTTQPTAESVQADAPRQEQARPERPQAEQARPSRPQADQPQTDRPRPERPETSKTTAGENVYAEQQEVLRDILNDDFARRVFEDIYSEIRKNTPPPNREERRVKREEPSRSQSMQAESVPKKAKGGLPFGLDQFKLDFSSGVGNTVKGWLRSQIDEEQTIRLPATGLYAGARVRLQIRRGLSEELTTLEVTLPADFVVGKPVRLRGMGKKLGSMQGDLYLTVVSR